MLKMRKITLCFQLLLWVNLVSNAQAVFTRLDSLTTYAQSRSTTLQSGNIALTRAKKARLGALLGIPDPTGQATFSYTHNRQLPVSLFPGELLGGQAGTYQEVAIGVPYVSNWSQDVNIKLLNIAGFRQWRLSKINIDLNESNNQVTLQSFRENIATIYFNIVRLQAQQQTAKESQSAADSLYQIAQNRYESGLVKIQDVNDAKVNALQTEESARQIGYLIEQQYLSLKVLSDIPEDEEIQIAHSLTNNIVEMASPVIEQNSLEADIKQLEMQYALVDYRRQKAATMPTISLFSSSMRQQNSTQIGLFRSDPRWIPSNYIGFRLVIPLPTATQVSQSSAAKYDYLLAQQEWNHAKLETAVSFKQLAVDHGKVVSQWRSDMLVAQLRQDSYEKIKSITKKG